MARKQKLFQSFSGIGQICAKFPDTEDKYDFKPLNIHRQSCKQQTVKARAFDLFYGCPTIFCMYIVAYLYPCQETGKERLRIN